MADSTGSNASTTLLYTAKPSPLKETQEQGRASQICGGHWVRIKQLLIDTPIYLTIYQSVNHLSTSSKYIHALDSRRTQCPSSIGAKQSKPKDPMIRGLIFLSPSDSLSIDPRKSVFVFEISTIGKSWPRNEITEQRRCSLKAGEEREEE